MKKEITIPLKVIAIDDDGYHVFISAIVNGKSARLLIDTGASKTVFDKKRVQRFVKKNKVEKIEKLSTGLGTNSMESHVTILKELQLAKWKVKNYKVVLLDLSHVNQSYRLMKLKPLDGVIGSDLLVKYKALIDYEQQQMKLQHE